MRFTYDGKLFEINFKRTFKRVSYIEGKTKLTVLSTHPFTTVKILELPSRNIMAQATVGCWHNEPTGFDPERGRVFALRKLTKELDKAFYTVMWKAYMNRPRGSDEKKRAPSQTGTEGAKRTRTDGRLSKLRGWFRGWLF